MLTQLLAPSPQDTERTACLRLLLGTLTACGDQDWARAAPALEQALEAGRQVEDLDVMGNLGNTALHLGHDEGARFYYAAMESTAREAGAGMVVVYALERHMFAQLPTGPWTAALSSADEALSLARSVGQPTLTAPPLACLALLAALTGSDDFDRHLTSLEDVIAQHPLGIMADPAHDVTRWAKGARATAQGDTAAALHHLSGMHAPSPAPDGHRRTPRKPPSARATPPTRCVGRGAHRVRRTGTDTRGPRCAQARTCPHGGSLGGRDSVVRSGRRSLPNRPAGPTTSAAARVPGSSCAATTAAWTPAPAASAGDLHGAGCDTTGRTRQRRAASLR